MHSETASTTSAQVVVACCNLDASLDFFCGQLGFRMDMIMPAEHPRIALLSGHGIALRLQVDADAVANRAPLALRLLGDAAQWSTFASDVVIGPDGVRVALIDRAARVAIPEAGQAFTISRADAAEAWDVGRAGMQYRDLIPGRVGGRFIASHIRIPDGGPVPDYVHYHHVRLQLIYCRRGWVRVVYEDQGEPFVMHDGDCVLQPPTIRHRVLEASPGLEVIEVSCPAEHETWRDHDLVLPTSELRSQRMFGGQRFVRHVAADAQWQPTQDARWECRDTGIGTATAGLGSARVLRWRDAGSDAVAPQPHVHHGEFLFLCVLDGQCRLHSRALGEHSLAAGDACVIPTGADVLLNAGAGCEVLEVALPAMSAVG